MLEANFWNKYFAVYDALNASPVYDGLLNEISQEADIKEGMNIIDVGVGTGNLVPKLERFGAKVTGVDFSPEALELCSKKNPSAVCHRVDISKPLTSFKDDEFDRIVSNNTLYNIDRELRPAVLKELYRILKPGSKIVISNVHQGFTPYKIYLETLRLSHKSRGLAETLKLFLKLLIPTGKIFYYNRIIQKAYKSDSKNLFDLEEQKRELENAGFINVSKTRLVFAGQGVLNSAYK